jgi:hypothetical protein
MPAYCVELVADRNPLATGRYYASPTVLSRIFSRSLAAAINISNESHLDRGLFDPGCLIERF